METSATIASLLGPTLVVLSITEFLNFRIWAKIDPTVVYLNGLFLFVGGLVIVRFHHHWHLDWTLVITLTGWSILLLGLYRCFFPVAPQLKQSGYANIVFALLLATGLFLTVKGYF